MTETFVDTSAFYAYLVPVDANHDAARGAIAFLRASRDELVTSTFVILETVSLLQARIGVQAVRTFFRDALPPVRIVTVDDGLLHRGMQALLAASRRRVSLTDWTSFAIMQDLRIDRAFAFDNDFTEQGFEVVPGR